MFIISFASGYSLETASMLPAAVFWRCFLAAISLFFYIFSKYISSSWVPRGFSAGCIEGWSIGGKTTLWSFSLLAISTLADFVTLSARPSSNFSLLTGMPFFSQAYLYNLIISSYSSSDSSELSLSLSINISRQSGSFPTLIRFSGLNKVFLGNFFLPLFFLLLMIRFRFLSTFFMIPSRRSTKLFQSSSVIVPPTSSRREWYGS